MATTIGGGWLAAAFLWCAPLQETPPAASPPAASATPRAPFRVADHYAPGAQAGFVFEQGGVAIGHSWWDYAGPLQDVAPPLHRFTGGWRIEQQGPLGKAELRASGEVIVDDGGHPRRAHFLSEVGGMVHDLEFVLADGQAQGRLISGPKSKPIVAPVGPDALLLANNWIGLMELIVLAARPEDGETLRPPLFHADSVSMLAFELRRLADYVVERDGVVHRGRKVRDSLGQVTRLREDGALFEIEIPAQGFRIRRTDAPLDRFTVAPPSQPRADFAREEVTLARGGFTLAGAVTKPLGATGRLPALLFVGGSGPQDRDGLSGGLDLGTHELLDAVTAAGFAVLRVDDRGTGASGGTLTGATLRDLADDARGWLELLRARDDVDPQRLFVIGHSEGGVIAPLLAAELPLCGVVLLAAPGRDLMALLREQKRAGLEAAGLRGKLLDDELAVHAEFLKLVAGDAPIDPQQVRADYRPALADRDWLRSHARHDPLATIAQVKCPVLIAQGEQDVQVSVERDAPPLLATLQAAGHPDATLAKFAALDHLFKKVTTIPPTTADYLRPRPVDPEFLATVVAWLAARAK